MKERSPLKKILKIFAVIIISAIAICSVATSVYADDACSVAGYDDPIICGHGGDDEEMALMATIKNVLNTVYLWIGILAVIYIVVGGVMVQISNGEQEKVKRGKNAITYAIIGLVVTIAAFAITNFVINALDGRAPSDPVANSGGTPDPRYGEDRKKVLGIVTIDETTLIAGQSYQIKARIVPDYAEDKTLTYTTNDKYVATVDEKGKVFAKKEGTAVITVESPSGVKKEITINVIKPIPVKSIIVDPDPVTIKKGKTVTVKATVKPANATNKTLTWKSNDTNIATVTQTGQIKGIKDGETTVTVSAFNQEIFSDEIVDDPSKLGTTITKVIKVTVSSDIAPTVGNQENVKYSMRLDFRKETRAIVDKHLNDFKYSNYTSEIKRRGGYTKYVNDLGGVFTLLGKQDKIKVKTAADLQLAAEYAWGLWTIWGIDYGNGKTQHSWGIDTKGGPTKDGFYYGLGGRTSNTSYSWESVNDMLKHGPNKVRTNCNVAITNFAKSTTLPVLPFPNGNSLAKKSKVGKIYYVDELKVGDMMHFFRDNGTWHHVVLVGEVYKDYVVTYEGGSRFMRSSVYKKAIKRAHTKKLTGAYSGEHDWFAVRVFDIDQSVTLAGIN